MILIHIEDGGTTASQEWGPDGARPGTTASQEWGPDGARPGTTASQEKGPGWSSPWNHAAIVWQCNICEWMILVFVLNSHISRLYL